MTTSYVATLLSSSSWWWSRLGDLPMQVEHRADRLGGGAGDLRIRRLGEIAARGTLRRSGATEAAEKCHAVDRDMLLCHGEPALGPLDAIHQVDQAEIQLRPVGQLQPSGGRVIWLDRR